MKGASLARMYLFFIGTWRLNILKIVSFTHTKIIYIRSSCNSIRSEFGFSFQNPILKSVSIKRWKSERTVSKALLCWNRFGRFVSIRSIHAGSLGFLKYVGILIKLFRQSMSQRFFIEFSSMSTLKSHMKMKLS